MKYLSGRKKTVIKPKFSRVQAILLSFYSPKLYVDVMRNWRGLGATYLLVMITVLTLPHCINSHIQRHQDLEQVLITPLKKLPPFSIYNGKAVFYGPQPFLVKNDFGEVIGVIDTTDTVSKLPDIRYPKAGLLVTKHMMQFNYQMLDVFTQADVSKQHTIQLPFASDLFKAKGRQSIVGEDLIKVLMLNWMKWAALFVVFVSSILFYCITYFVFLFSFTIFGQFIASFVFKCKLTFKETMRLLCVSVTPQAVVFFSALTFDQMFVQMKYVSLVVYAIYFSLAVLACRNDRKALALT